MKNTAIELLNCLLEFVNLFEPISNIELKEELFYKKLSEIRTIYKSLDDYENIKLSNLITNNFDSDPQLHVFVLSILLEAAEDNLLLEQIVKILVDRKLSINQTVFTYLQITRYNFAHSGSENRYRLRRILHASILDRFKEELSLQFDYRKLEERNLNRIVIVTGTIIGINHAPSRQVLDQCYRLQKILNKEVLLVVCPIESPVDYELSWLLPNNLNYNNDYENELFNISYKDGLIKTFQLAIKIESMHLFNNLISAIYDFNPLFILSMGSYFSWEDVMSQFNTVVAKEMSIHYPVSEAPILFCNKGVKEEIVKLELDYLFDKGQIPLEYKINVDIDEAETLLQRYQFNINENAFVLVIVGNRLDTEITEEYSKFLDKLLDIDNRLNLAFIGNYNKYTLKDNKKNRVFYLGFQSDLAGAYHVADLFLNPPRNGGGMSALSALYNGVPVVTLPDCDVANNIGKDFISNNYTDMINVINKYLNDDLFYKEQQRKGLELTHKDISEDAGLGEMIEDIINVIKQKEHENK